MIDEQIREALAPFRQVEASFDLPSPASTGGPFVTPRRVAVGAAALVLVVAMMVLDAPPPDVEPSTRALDLSAAEQVMFSDGETVSVEELFDAANLDRMQELFADHGAELVVKEKPVTAAHAGQVLGIQIPAGMAAEGDADQITLLAGGQVEVTVGRESDEPELTLYEMFPEIRKAVVYDDPVATGKALEALGFKVRWVHITAAGEGRDVASPPSGTVVLPPLGPNGEGDGIDPTIDTLMVEIATPEVAASLGH